MSTRAGTPPSNDLPNDICDYLGLIRDQEIDAATNSNFLLIRERIDPARIRQASYELRLSDHVEFLVINEAPQEQATAKYERPANGIGERLKIQPGQTVKVYTIEIFNLPTNVVAHVFPVGNIYKLGLSPETTYADPGFDGEFYIILCNYSSRIVELRVGQAIARVEFIKLARSTTKPHAGSKAVTEPELWPRRIDRRSMDALRQIGIDGLLDELHAKDPPNLEHAFIAREVREQVGQYETETKQKLSSLSAELARYRLVAYIAIAIALTWLGTLAWVLLPSNVQTMVTERTASVVLGALALFTPLLMKHVRRTISLAFLGRP